MPRKYPRSKERQLSKERISILWEQAQKSTRAGQLEIAREQMRSARKIAQKTRTKLPRSISRRVCKSCGAILIPGRTSRIRVRSNRSRHVVMTCTNCGDFVRYYITGCDRKA